jgi:hypothetical protein
MVRSRDLAVALLLVLALIWPALYNGQSLFFYDSLYYERATDASVMGLFHLPPHTAFRAGSAALGWPVNSEEYRSRNAATKDKTVLLERSPYYGALLYLGDLVGRYWPTLLLQAAAAIAVLALLIDAVRLPQSYLVPLAIALALLSSLPFYASFLMPDVFTGFVIAGCAVLLTGAVRLSRWQLALWWLLLAAGALFHDTNLLILCTLFAGALLLRVFTGRGARVAGLVAVLAAIAVGGLGELAFIHGAARWYAVAPMHPPYLTARLIEDGTAVRYLRATCPDNGFEVCRFLDRFPMSADDFLWREHAGSSAFATASAQQKRRVSAQQGALLRSVIAYDPAAQLRASLGNAARQFVSIGLQEFGYEPIEKRQFEATLPRDVLPRLHASAAYHDRMPLGVWELILKVSFWASLGFIATMLLWPRGRRSLPPALVRVTAWIVFGVVVNAIYCGVLSGPHDRYATRVQWLLPLAAMLILAHLPMRRMPRPRAERAPR